MKKRIVKSSTNEKRKGAGFINEFSCSTKFISISLGIYIGYDKIYRVEKVCIYEYIATYNGNNNNVLTLNDKQKRLYIYTKDKFE